MDTDVDVLIVGAGLSGIGAAAHLARTQPRRSYAILEARDAIGGTWDLFRYPGIRSDSDLYTFAYAFNPWPGRESIADAPSILDYIRRTAAEHEIEQRIDFGHAVRRASWSTEDGCWTLEADHDGGTVTRTARWLFCAGGYYRYDRGHEPAFPGADDFAGRIVHPQHWPAGLDYAGKRVVVIGSGATAMTIVPAMAGEAEHVTLLQRTPSFVLPMPRVDPLAARLRRWLGPRRAHGVIRTKNILVSRAIYKTSRRWPDRLRRLIRRINVRALPDGYDVDTHFRPPYDPWDQRLCLVPDGDLFKAIGEGSVSRATDHVGSFTEQGIELASGGHLDADIVVTATGLRLQALGGVDYEVDGQAVDLPDTVSYKGMMLTGVPNFVYAVGYTNASWTLKVDLVCSHFSRLLDHMDAAGAAWCVPQPPPPGEPTAPLLDFAAGYVQRSVDQFPRQGVTAPWEVKMDYLRDRRALLRGPVGDHMRFGV